MNQSLLELAINQIEIFLVIYRFKLQQINKYKTLRILGHFERDQLVHC